MGFRGLSKSERLIIGYIEKHLTDSDGDLDEEVEKRIDELQMALSEAGLTIDDLAQNLDILMFVLYDDFDEVLAYIRKKAIAIKNKNAKISCIIESHNIIGNQKEDSVSKIIDLLEQNGLSDILGYNPNNRKLIYVASPEKIRENLYYLSQMSDYKSQIRSNPELLYKYSISDIKKMIDEKNKKNQEEEKENDEQKEEDNKKSKEVIEDNKKIEQEQEQNEKENENNNMEGKSEEEILEGLEYIGEEPEILKLKEVFRAYKIPVSLLTNNPDICYRIIRCSGIDRVKQFKSINSILKIFAASGLSFSIIERCPSILSQGSKGKIEAILKQLGQNNLSLDLCYICPEILLKSNPEKIARIVTKLEESGVNKYYIYSCPQVLVSGNVKSAIEASKELSNKVPDIDKILDASPIVFIGQIQNAYLERDDTDIEISKKLLKDSEKILYIKDISKAQENIDLLKEQGIDLEIIKKDSQILVQAKKDEMEQVVEKLRSYKFDNEFIEENPSILYLATANIIEDVTNTIKESRPNTFQDIIRKVPEIYTKTDSDRVGEVFDVIEDLGIRYKVVDKEPEILLREDPQEIVKVVDNLTQEHDVLISSVEENPRIISEGKEKYINRNYETFRMNNLVIPFSFIYTKSARNNEKNIDTLVENGLNEYIETTPEILNVEHAKVVQYIKIAKEEDIPLVVRDDKKKKVLNMEYFASSPEEVSQDYGIDISKIEEARADIDKNPPRRVKNPELYVAVLPQFFAQADLTLDEYKNDDISYKKYDQVVSKQKVVREAYIDLERASIRLYNSTYSKAIQEGLSEKEASRIAKKEIKSLIKIPVISKQLDKTLERLTKKVTLSEEIKTKKNEPKVSVQHSDISKSAVVTRISKLDRNKGE